MPVILNLKRCDNVKECSAPASCPTQAFYWDEDKRTLATDISKCIDCGLCEKACPSGAVLVVSDEGEYNATVSLIENDPQTIEDLFVDRYGAMTVANTKEPPITELDSIINDCTSTIAIEVLDADNPSCLISAVPYSIIFNGKDIPLYKIMVSGDTLKSVKKYFEVDSDPALILCRKGKIVAKYQGAVKEGSKEVRKLIKFIQNNA